MDIDGIYNLLKNTTNHKLFLLKKNYVQKMVLI